MQTYSVTKDEEGTIEWYVNGKLHREDGPAYETACGIQEWYQNGKLHRDTGPAVFYPRGCRVFPKALMPPNSASPHAATYWYQNGLLHRHGGPAIELIDGTKYWYVHGKLHREVGPAVEHANGTNAFYLYDKLQYRIEPDGKIVVPRGKEKLDQTFPRENNLDGKIIVIDGRKYELTEL